MASMKGIFPLLLLGGAVYLIAKNKKTESPLSTGDILASPSGKDALSNISATYSPEFAQGVKDALEGSASTREALDKIRRLPTYPTAPTKTSTPTRQFDTQALVKQTSLKQGGGAKGLADGSYNISGLKSPVTVRSVPKTSSIAYKKGYIK